MQRLIQLFLVVSLLVLHAAAFNHGVATTSASLGKRRMTNAERLARGLPPNPPAVRYTPGVMRARDGASATTTSSSSTTSSSPSTSPTPPVPCPKTGYIACSLDGHGGYYVSEGTGQNVNIYGQADAAFVTFDACALGPVNMQCLNCNTHNQDTEYIVLYNISTGSGWEWTLVTTNQPVGDYETTVWSFDSTTSALTLKWTYDDGSVINLNPGVTNDEEGFDTYFVIPSSNRPALPVSLSFEEQS